MNFNMKNGSNILRYLLVALFLLMGTMHFIMPEQYLAMMPSWLPAQLVLIYGSGLVEIALAVLLIPVKTRALAAKLIIAMLVIFLFAIHIPQSIDFYQTGNKNFVASLIRLPIQFLLIAWAWPFTKETTATTI